MKKFSILYLIKIFFKKIYKKTVEFFFFIIYGPVQLF
jgi:hypothetical protein